MMMSLVSDARADRAAIWPSIRAALIAHEKSEVRELYPVLRLVDPALADDHDADARHLDGRIVWLDSMACTNDLWLPLFQEIETAVLAHAGIEESEIFPRARALLGDAKSIELSRTVELSRLQIASAA